MIYANLYKRDYEKKKKIEEEKRRIAKEKGKREKFDFSHLKGFVRKKEAR